LALVSRAPRRIVSSAPGTLFALIVCSNGGMRNLKVFCERGNFPKVSKVY